MRRSIEALCDKTAWGKWIPLENCWRGKTISTSPGLYRILLVDGEWRRMAYIGQSKNLKERLGALKHIYNDVPPLHTPHFAGPFLWEWLQRYPQGYYEVSVAPFPGVPKQLRLGLECLAIALHHEEDRRSPLVNFGRTRLEWLAAWQCSDEQQEAMMGPIGPLSSNPQNSLWCGLAWTPWVTVQEAQISKEARGLYRLRTRGCDPLLTIGQGKLSNRLKAYQTFPSLECSWIESDWEYHRRLELVSELVGAHLLAIATVPLWQFQSDLPFGGPDEVQTAA